MLVGGDCYVSEWLDNYLKNLDLDWNDPAVRMRVEQHRQNAYADHAVHQTMQAQRALKYEHSWEYYKRGYEPQPIKRDRRLKGWRNWED